MNLGLDFFSKHGLENSKAKGERKAFSERERERERRSGNFFLEVMLKAGFIIENENFRARTCERGFTCVEIF